MANGGIKINFNHLPKIIKNNPAKVDELIGALAFEGERIVKQSMERTPKNGNVYPRGENVHIASSAGNPPAIDSGTLVNSIYVYKLAIGKRMISAGTDYAFLLEFGSQKMAARPFMMPMLYELEDQSGVFFDNLINV